MIGSEADVQQPQTQTAPNLELSEITSPVTTIEPYPVTRVLLLLTSSWRRIHEPYDKCRR